MTKPIKATKARKATKPASKPASRPASFEQLMRISDAAREAIERVSKKADERIRALEGRIADLEDRDVTTQRAADPDEPRMLAGAYESGLTYRRNAHVTWRGELWRALKDTNERPPHADWMTLASGSITFRKV